MKRPTARRSLLALATAVGVFAIAVPASAHVTVTAPGATRGGSDQEITFRVPVEQNSDTVKLSVSLPTATPIASVDVKPIPGWTHTQQTSKLATPIKTDDGTITEAVTEITWTAGTGQGLQPGEYGDFTIIAGQLPNTATLVFGAIQTYANGSVVRWNQTAAAGSTVEPEDPAPTLDLAAASSSSSAQPSATVTTTATKATTASTTAPTVLAIVALVLAAAALGVAVVGNARRRSTG